MPRSQVLWTALSLTLPPSLALRSQGDELMLAALHSLPRHWGPCAHTHAVSGLSAHAGALWVLVHWPLLNDDSSRTWF